MTGGYRGRIGFVDLSKGEIREEKLDETLARDFIGGYGLGVRILFERQKKGMSLRVLSGLRAAWVFVSFPTRSLGGQDKGMRETYRKFMQELLERVPRQAECFEFPAELCYLLRKQGE